MKISVFTPVHAKAVQFLQETYDSLRAQTFRDWEWVVVLNNGGVALREMALDERIRIVHAEDDDQDHNLIGRLKGLACSQAKGELLVELDADDLLTQNALERIAEAFANPKVMMAYSNDAEFHHGSWEPNSYSEYWGWENRPFAYQGHDLIESVAWPPGPQMMRSIHFAPNHVRAWRAEGYFAIGGHNQDLKTGDDHDLCCRMFIAYGADGIRHIDECLYLYRVHGANSCVTHNALVQEQNLKNYLQYSRDMIARWAQDEGLRMLDLGGRLNAWGKFTTVDLMGADVIADLNAPWPFPNNSVGVIRASHVFEHLRNPVHTMNEAYRVLAPGGWLLIDVPSTDGRGAFQDPGHVSFWNENSIWYYTNRDFARFAPDFHGRFQASRVLTYFPSEFEREHNIPIVQADLIALKGAYSERPAGEVLI